MMSCIRKIVCLAVWICIGLSGAYPNPHSIVKLKDGSVLKGDVIVQRPGKDVTVQAEEATFVISSRNLKNRSGKKTPYDKLSREWKRWALENNALSGDAYGRYLVLEDVVSDKYSLQNVAKAKERKNETGSASMEYIQVVPSVYKIKWGDVDEIKLLQGKENENKGLDDEVTTKAGKKYVGRIISQHPGKDMTMRTSKGIETLSSSDILEMKKLSGKGTTSWRGQTDYSNTIVCKNGDIKKGLLLCHYFGKNGKGSHVELLTENSRREKIDMAEIEEYQTQYDGHDTSPYKVGKVYVNEFLIQPAKVSTYNGNKGFVDARVYPFPEGITTTFKTQGGKFQGAWTLIALEDVEIEGGKRTKGYDSKIKGDNSIDPSSVDMSAGISSLSFVYLSPGYYALTNSDETESYIIKIVK